MAEDEKVGKVDILSWSTAGRGAAGEPAITFIADENVGLYRMSPEDAAKYEARRKKYETHPCDHFSQAAWDGAGAARCETCEWNDLHHYWYEKGHSEWKERGSSGKPPYDFPDGPPVPDWIVSMREAKAQRERQRALDLLGITEEQLKSLKNSP